MGSPLEFDLGQVAERLACRYLVATGLTAAEAAAIGRLGLFLKIYALEDGPDVPDLDQPDDPAISMLRTGPCPGLAACGPMLAPEVPAIWWLGGFAEAAQLVPAARAIVGGRNVAADLILIELPSAAPDETGNADLRGTLQEILGATHRLDFDALAHRGQVVALPLAGPGQRARSQIACRMAVARDDLAAADRLTDNLAAETENGPRADAMRGMIAMRRLSSLFARIDPDADIVGNLLARIHRKPESDPRIADIVRRGSATAAVGLLRALHLAHVDGPAAAVAALPQTVTDGSAEFGARTGASWKDFAAALPMDPDLRVAIAAELSARGLRGGALQMLDDAVATPGIGAAALFEVGKAFDGLDESRRAADAYRRALDLQPDHAAAHNNLAMILFLDGAFEAAWEHNEWRFAAKGLVRPALAGPVLQTSDVSGATILVLGEQGIGDHIQFARYARALHARGNRIVFAVRDEMIGFLRSQDFVASAIGNGDPVPAHDAHVDLLSLGRLFGAPFDPLPACTTQYLRVDPARLDSWRRRLAHLPSPRVAIA